MMTPKNPTDIFSIIQKRRSVRSFTSDPISPEHIEQMQEALRWAPSAGNRQPWHFYFVFAKETRKGLAAAAFNQDFISQAPLAVVVCALPGKSASRYGKRGQELYVYQDTAAAVQNLLLLATSLGYGTCWVGAFDENRVKLVLRLPEEIRPVAIIPIGQAAENPAPPQRLPREKIITIVQ
jgi:nitroreductase